jgi:hypothetical protein
MKSHIRWVLGIGALVTGATTALILAGDFAPSGLATGVAEEAPEGSPGEVLAARHGEVACLGALRTALPGLPRWDDACGEAPRPGEVAELLPALELRHACFAPVTDALRTRAAAAARKVRELQTTLGGREPGAPATPVDQYSLPALDATWEEDPNLLAAGRGVDDEQTTLTLLRHFAQCAEDLPCPVAAEAAPPAASSHPACPAQLRNLMREFERYHSYVRRAWVLLRAVESLLRVAGASDDGAAACYSTRAAALLRCDVRRLLEAADDGYDAIPELLSAVDDWLEEAAPVSRFPRKK